jgi:hypothetical protein
MGDAPRFELTFVSWKGEVEGLESMSFGVFRVNIPDNGRAQHVTQTLWHKNFLDLR